MVESAEPGTVAPPAGRERHGRFCCRSCSPASSSRSFGATSSMIPSAGPRRSSSPCGCGPCCGAPRSSSASAKRSGSTSSIRAVSERTRRVFTVITGIVVVFLYGVSLPASYCYVSFMKVERSAYLHVPINWMYSVYLIFAVACICRYGWLVYRAFARRPVARDRPDAARGLIMASSPFALCIAMIVLLGAFGLPIGHSMIVASIFYLLLSPASISARPPSRSSTVCSTATSCSRSRCSSSLPT